MFSLFKAVLIVVVVGGGTLARAAEKTVDLCTSGSPENLGPFGVSSIFEQPSANSATSVLVCKNSEYGSYLNLGELGRNFKIDDKLCEEVTSKITGDTTDSQMVQALHSAVEYVTKGRKEFSVKTRGYRFTLDLTKGKVLTVSRLRKKELKCPQ